MAETVLINAATVLAGAASAVEAYQIAVPPEVDFRIVCDKAYTVRFYVANADFSDVASAAELSGTDDTHAATTGIVYRVDAGSYDYVAAVVTNDDVVDAATVTVVVGYDLVAEAPTALFTVAEARAFDKAQLASVVDYPDAAIIAKEAEIREFLAQVCSVDFIPTVHTDEYQDGLGSSSVLLDWPLPTAIAAAYTRSSTTWTALTADELAALQLYDSGEVYWDCGYWPCGRNNVKLTYTAGHATVPDLVKRAALRIATLEMPTSNVSFAAESYDGGGMSVSFANGDGFNGHWHRDPDVMKAIRMYDRSLPGVC